jgi:hypothetical protein
MYAMHQVAKYSLDPRCSHGKAILYLVWYLKKTRDLGIHFKPVPGKGFLCYLDADFLGNWNRSFAATDPSTAKSHSGWIVFYAGCPVCWASKLQSQVALLTTEAEYIAMSQALCDIIPIMGLLQEMRSETLAYNVLNHIYTARFLKTILAPLNLQDFQNYAQGQSISMFAIIIFVSMYGRDL